MRYNISEKIFYIIILLYIFIYKTFKLNMFINILYIIIKSNIFINIIIYN